MMIVFGSMQLCLVKQLKQFVMKRLFKISTFFLISFFTTFCSKDDARVETPKTEVIKDIYIAGRGGIYKNGEFTPVNSLSIDAIFITDTDDFYMVQKLINTASQSIIKYSKNYVPSYIGYSPPFMFTSSMYVNGNDVHIVDWNNYWKNGEKITLTSDLSYRNSDVIVSNNDIYITANQRISSTLNKAVYFKNGVVTNLTDGTRNATANAIAISGTDVYIAGSESNGTKLVAKYWKNDIPVELSNGENDVKVTDITIKNNDVYVVGTERIGSVDIPKYWKNGVEVALELENPVSQVAGNLYPYRCETNKIQVIGNDVFVGGYEMNAAGLSVVKYWKNGQSVFVNNTPATTNATNTIFITTKLN